MKKLFSYKKFEEPVEDKEERQRQIDKDSLVELQKLQEERIKVQEQIVVVNQHEKDRLGEEEEEEKKRLAKQYLMEF